MISYCVIIEFLRDMRDDANGRYIRIPVQNPCTYSTFVIIMIIKRVRIYSVLGLFKYTYVKYNPVHTHNRNKTISLL